MVRHSLVLSAFLTACALPVMGSAQSISFSGTVDQAYDRITIPVDGGASANIGATDFTIEIWLRPNANSNNGSGTAWWQGNIFIDRDILGNLERAFGASLLSGRVTFMTHPAGGGQTVFTATSDIRDDNWHWIVITYDRSSGGVQIYVDGQREVNSAGSAGDMSFSSSSNTKNRLIELGGEKHFQGTPSYVGRLSELRFSGTVRYTTSTIPVPSSPLTVDGDTVAYWSFSEGSGSVLNDSAAGSSHGTIVFGGSPTVPAWSADSPYSGGSSSGTIQLGQATINVPESATTVTPTVVRSGGSSGTATVDVETSAGTATAGGDFETTMTQVSWNDGEQGSRNVTINLFPDNQPEPDETFQVELANATGATLGTTQSTTITIIDDDTAGAPGTIQFTRVDFSASEGGAAASISVNRQGGSTGAISADYATADGSARSGSDYQGTAGTISYADAETGEKNFTVTIIDDVVEEAAETVNVSLSGANVGTPSAATLTIQDNDAAPPDPGDPPPKKKSGSGAFDWFLLAVLAWGASARFSRGSRRVWQHLTSVSR